MWEKRVSIEAADSPANEGGEAGEPRAYAVGFTPYEVGIDSSRVAAAGECVCKSILGRGQLVGLDLDAEIDAECSRKAEELSVCVRVLGGTARAAVPRIDCRVAGLLREGTAESCGSPEGMQRVASPRRDCRAAGPRRD